MFSELWQNGLVIYAVVPTSCDKKRWRSICKALRAGRFPVSVALFLLPGETAEAALVREGIGHWCALLLIEKRLVEKLFLFLRGTLLAIIEGLTNTVPAMGLLETQRRLARTACHFPLSVRHQRGHICTGCLLYLASLPSVCLFRFGSVTRIWITPGSFNQSWINALKLYLRCLYLK